MTTRRPTVMIFLMADLGGKDGAAAWARHLLFQLRQIEGIRFVVVTSETSSRSRDHADAILEGAFEHVAIQWRENGAGTSGTERWVGVKRTIQRASDHIGEQLIRKQSHIDREFKAIVETVQPDLVMINDIWAAFHLPAVFDSNVRKCLILLNDEVSFHKQLLSYLGSDLTTYRWSRWIAQFRFRRKFERIVRRCQAIVVLTRNDIPKMRPANQLTAVLPPLLSEQSRGWEHTKSRRLLFVGHIRHFSNRYAIEWICTRLMPAMSELDDTVTMCIVGATDDCVPAHWRSSSVVFLGDAGREGIVRHLLSDDLFVAPISNPFGAKLKLAECAAYGMPFVATDAAMSGLPFLPNVPRIDLANPRAAALIIKQCIESGKTLRELSMYIEQETRKARCEQTQEWRVLVRRALECEVYARQS